jgi:hypothetical protein
MIAQFYATRNKLARKHAAEKEITRATMVLKVIAKREKGATMHRVALPLCTLV